MRSLGLSRPISSNNINLSVFGGNGGVWTNGALSFPSPGNFDIMGIRYNGTTHEWRFHFNDKVTSKITFTQAWSAITSKRYINWTNRNDGARPNSMTLSDSAIWDRELTNGEFQAVWDGYLAFINAGPGSIRGGELLRYNGTDWAPSTRGKFDATVVPTVTDDLASGYETGSFWYLPAVHRAFTCVNPATGAAVWHEINHSGTLSAQLRLTNTYVANVVTISTPVAYTPPLGDANIAQVGSAFNPTHAVSGNLVYTDTLSRSMFVTARIHLSVPNDARISIDILKNGIPITPVSVYANQYITASQTTTISIPPTISSLANGDVITMFITNHTTTDDVTVYPESTFGAIGYF